MFVRHEVVSDDVYSASVRHGNLGFVFNQVDSDQVKGDIIFTVEPFEFLEIILTEFCELGNFCFHVLYLQILFCLSARAMEHMAKQRKGILKGTRQKSTTRIKLLHPCSVYIKKPTPVKPKSVE